MHPFEIGRSYDREQILAFLGSKQRQSGIVYGKANREYIAVFTGGRSGRRAGYEDGWGPDGTFLYCGQGSKGDQRLARANKVLANHRGIVLLFETWKPKNTWKGKQRFLGEFTVLGFDWFSGSGTREGDRLLVFSLLPAAGLTMPRQAPDIRYEELNDIAVLRSKAIEASRESTPARMTLAEYRTRSLVVARYVLARARGTCEACGKPAPFIRPNGTPFLEVHHTRRLADDGPDDIMHVAALCPNCHREAHLGANVNRFRENLEEKIKVKERGNEER